VSPPTEAVRVKLDENLGRSHVALLRRAGYPADRLTDQGLSGATDAAVWAHVCTEGRFALVDLGAYAGQGVTLVLRAVDLQEGPAGAGAPATGQPK
jgi:hypothetical protein